MQDLPVMLKLHNIQQSLDKALAFYGIKILLERFHSLNSLKNVRWPLITSIQCTCTQGRIQDFWKGGSYVFRCGVRLLILSHFSLISYQNEIIWSH